MGSLISILRYNTLSSGFRDFSGASKHTPLETGHEKTLFCWAQRGT